MDSRAVVLISLVFLASGCIGSSTSSDAENVDIQKMEAKSVDIVENISRLSSEGGGTTVKTNFDGMEARVNESGNFLELKVESEKKVYPENFILVDGKSKAGIGEEAGFGFEQEDQPGVVMAKTENGTTTFRIEFRKMRVYQKPYEIYKIQLKGPEKTVNNPKSLDMTLLTSTREEVKTTFETRPAQIRTVNLEFNR